MKNPKFSLQFLDPFFEKISKLTKLHRILICVGTVAVIVGPVIYFSYLPKREEIKTLTGEYQKLAQELAVAKRRASQLGKYKAEMKEVEAKFEVAKQALPDSEEIPTLLTSISHAGQDSGLEFLLFKPEAEEPQGFYAEIPVAIEVVGEYHDTAIFFQKVSHLSRIVNIKDVQISTPAQIKRNMTEEDKNELSISCTAVTYKFLEQTPETTSKKK